MRHNNYLAIMIVFAIVAGISHAASPLYDQSQPKPGTGYGWDDAAQDWRANRVDADGNSRVIDARGRVSAPTQYGGTIATGTITNLTAMASYTSTSIVRVQFNNTVYEAAATSTVATVQAGNRVGQYDTLMILPDSATYNESFIAATTAASYSVLVYEQVP